MSLSFNVPLLPETESAALTFIYYLFTIAACHALGDYFLQTEYQAVMKGKDWYLLYIHSILYTLPFALAFGLSLKILFLLATHIVIDAAKARYQKITLLQDQILHYGIAFFLFALRFV